jgi:hypothetical protein
VSRRRRGRRPGPPPAAASKPPPPPVPTEEPASSGRSWLFVLFVALAGALIGRYVTSDFPSGARDSFDLLLAVGFAFVLAASYRRWMRGVIQRRRESQQQRRR